MSLLAATVAALDPKGAHPRPWRAGERDTGGIIVYDADDEVVTGRCPCCESRLPAELAERLCREANGTQTRSDARRSGGGA